MKLAILLVSLLFLATTTPMIEAKKKPKPNWCEKKCKKYDTGGSCETVCDSKKGREGKRCMKTCEKCKKRCKKGGKGRA